MSLTLTKPTKHVESVEHDYDQLLHRLTPYHRPCHSLLAQPPPKRRYNQLASMSDGLLSLEYGSMVLMAYSC
jgi:hypothetical protein